jgi:hypothetical protein
VNRRRLGSGEPPSDRAPTLYVVHDNSARAGALSTAAEEPHRAAGRRVVRRRRAKHVVQVHVPDGQAPLFNLPGPHGGWYVSLLDGQGEVMDISMEELRELIAGSRGEVIVALRLTPEEASSFDRFRANSDQEAHARFAYEKQLRPQDNRSESAKLALRETPCTGDEPDKHRGGA